MTILRFYQILSGILKMFKPSWTTVLTGIFIAYILNSVYTIYQLYLIPPCKEDRHCIPSFLQAKPKFRLHFYTSPSEDVSRVKRMKELFIWDEFDYQVSHEKSINITVPQQVFKNGSAYIHVFLVPKQGQAVSDLNAIIQRGDVTAATGKLTSYAVPEAATFNLLGGTKKTENGETDKLDEKKRSKTAVVEKPVSQWCNRIVLEMVTDSMPVPTRGMPHELIRFITVTPQGQYLPTIVVDNMSYRIKDLMVVSEDKKEMPLHVVYNPISFGKLRLWVQLESAMKTMTSLGFTEKDTDEVKGIFTDTNLYLLCMTFIVASFHLLFDFLAFKNDISFWRRRKTMVGLSSRTVIWRCVSHFIIFLYLMDEQTSLLVLIPSGVGTIIEVWKVFRAFKISISLSRPFVRFGKTTDDENRTQEYDAEIMKYLSYLMYPLCAGGAIYSLMYMPHKTWYSWCVQSLVNGVYAFGFLFMLPQLFVNYKLKSVAHLPWKAFMYKAFNTFIDDVFAFIITMPTAHRVACFRDDIVFVVYLYQRWLYPVDKTRVNEFGESYEDEKGVNVVETKSKKESKKSK